MEAQRHSRRATIDSRIDTETGEFDMVMATEGEASDGHILSMRGLSFPNEIPLQLDHNRSALATLGTVSNIRLDKIDGVPGFRGTGRIRLSGEGDQLAARRDLVDAISRGDVRGTSLTWDADKFTERRSLPKGHPAAVSREEENPRRRYGLFFEKARGIEQSIVAIPSDREALIGRSESASGEIAKELWHSLIERLSDNQNKRESEIINALERSVETLEQRLRDAEDTSSDTLPIPSPDMETIMSALDSQIGDWRARTANELGDALETILERVTGRR